MILALLVSLICLEVPASAPLSISVIKHWDDGSISSKHWECHQRGGLYVFTLTEDEP